MLRSTCSGVCAAVLACLLVLPMGGCKKPPGAATTVPVKVKILEPEDIAVSRQFSASVEPLQTTSLAFKLAGTVQSLHRPPGLNRDVQVGDTLAKGTVIAQLDEGDLRRARASAEAKVAQLEARVSALEEIVGQLTGGGQAAPRPFIGSEMRPDLSQGALLGEEDATNLQQKMRTGSAAAKRQYDTKSRE